jgi:hypothetical protein
LAFGTLPKKRFEKDSVFRKKKLDELDSIASTVKKAGDVPALHKIWEAANLDCFLYARHDQYK